MKLLAFEKAGSSAAGVISGDGIVDLTKLSPDLKSVSDIIDGGEPLMKKIREVVQADTADLAVDDAKLLCPLNNVGKYLAIGLNYQAHVDESRSAGGEPPEHQYWFNKQTTCLSGPYDEIDPGVSEQLDYEVELCAVVGKKAKNVTEGDALDHVFGYLVANDVSARDWQFHAPSFTVGKSFDTHGPIGPWVVTADEIADPQSLDLKCWVNGELRQSSNSRNMLFNIREQISYLSTAFTLEPGDLLATGTPEGVGMAMKPPMFLQVGDVVKCEIEGIGAIENRIN